MQGAVHGLQSKAAQGHLDLATGQGLHRGAVHDHPGAIGVDGRKAWPGALAFRRQLQGAAVGGGQHDGDLELIVKAQLVLGQDGLDADAGYLDVPHGVARGPSVKDGCPGGRLTFSNDHCRAQLHAAWDALGFADQPLHLGGQVHNVTHVQTGWDRYFGEEEGFGVVPIGLDARELEVVRHGVLEGGRFKASG